VFVSWPGPQLRTGCQPGGVFIAMKTKIRALTPLLIVVVTLIVAACNNGSGGTGY
jgi:predicted small secreted protein